MAGVLFGDACPSIDAWKQNCESHNKTCYPHRHENEETTVEEQAVVPGTRVRSLIL